MAYALRFSPNIHGDISRNWSAWMGLRDKDLWSLLEDQLLPHGVDMDEEWERYQDEDYETWWLRDHNDRQAFLEHLAGEHDIPVGFDEHSGEWCIIHHEGLSAYELDAITEAEAIIEGREMAGRIGLPSGDGIAATGNIRIVAEVAEGWYVLECDEIDSVATL